MENKKSIRDQYVEFRAKEALHHLRQAVFDYLYITNPSSPEARSAVYEQVVKDIVDEFYNDLKNEE